MKNSYKNKKVKPLDWNLDAILENRSLDDLYQQWKKALKQCVIDYDNGKCYQNLNQLKKYLKTDLKFSAYSNRIWNYITNQANVDVANDYWTGWEQKLNAELEKIELIFANEDNVILENELKIREFLKDEELKPYARIFNFIFRTKPYVLSKQQEEVLTKLQGGAFDAGGIYQVLAASDIKFKPAINSKHKSYPIKNETQAYLFLKRNDRALRKSAWLSLQSAFLEHKNTISKLLYHNYLSLNVGAKVRNFKNFIQAQAFGDEVDENFINFVHNEVKQYTKSWIRFQNLTDRAIKKKYHLSKVRPWDRELDLFSVKQKYSVNDAKALVLKALGCFGTKYQEQLQRIFAHHWISWLPKSNKQSGAYSIGGIYGLKQFYILLNYDYSLDGVFALIHEMGHSMHSWYLTQHQTLYCETDTFCAEIASLVNEVLLSLFLLDTQANNLKMKATIYQKIISNFFGTTIFQIMLSDFELQMIENIEKQQPIDAGAILKIYANAHVKYAGTSHKQYNNIINKKKYKGLSSVFRVDHFYSGSLYVYKYAVSQVIAINIAKSIYAQDEQALKQYFKFLTLGLSQPPLEAIKTLGIDIWDHKYWLNALEIINTLIDDYQKLLKQLKLIK